MAEATLAQLLTAVADLLRDTLTFDGLHVQPGLFRSAEMPAINIYPAARALTQDLAAFGDLYGGWPMNIRVAVSPADIEAGENLLWAFMDDSTDPLSVIAALDSDHTLGGIADDLAWGDWAGYQDFGPIDEPGKFIGSTLPIIVAKAGS